MNGGPWQTLAEVSAWQVGHPRAKLVLIAIAACAGGDEREGYISLRRIAVLAEVTPKQARNWIRKLEVAGWVKTEPRFRDGRQTANLYRVIGEGTKLDCPKEQAASLMGGGGSPGVEGGEGEAQDFRGEGEAQDFRPEDQKEDQKEVPHNPKVKNGNLETHPTIFNLDAPVKASRPVPMAEVATTVIAHLNAATGSKFRPVSATLDLICARLREPGVDVAGVLKMIDRQVARWRGTEMEQYLRPSTLFRASKFNDYYAAKDMPVASRSLRPQSFVQRDQHIADGGSGSFADMTVGQGESLDAVVNR
jgi:uncharacterized phage protein (TIGR02220 family)